MSLLSPLFSSFPAQTQRRLAEEQLREADTTLVSVFLLSPKIQRLAAMRAA